MAFSGISIKPVTELRNGATGFLLANSFESVANSPNCLGFNIVKPMSTTFNFLVSFVKLLSMDKSNSSPVSNIKVIFEFCGLIFATAMRSLFSNVSEASSYSSSPSWPNG